MNNQLDKLAAQLLEERNDSGFWTGRLSSSALSTAVALVALQLENDPASGARIRSGLEWLHRNVNKDGGFGDTPESKSNVSTSLLCFAALSYCKAEDVDNALLLKGIANYLSTQGLFFTSQNITAAVLKYYGKDLTFSVPILSMLALCGVLSEEVYSRIPQLPFELTLLPTSLYRFFNLQVVSYAVPALVAVGIFIFKKRKRHHLLTRYVRERSISPAISKLSETMPQSGGFLEAIPLTGFVSMCLMDSGMRDHSVVLKGISFLKAQQRADGSWPIDSDLSTWVTTLSIKAFGPKLDQFIPAPSIDRLRSHLLQIQYKMVHPFNSAQPGGWGWTNWTGSVPDADDTPGAILALLEMYQGSWQEILAVVEGVNWLVGLQNRDGGIPSFCKGWGRLPFDSSCADLSGHALLAIVKSMHVVGYQLTPRTLQTFESAARRITGYLQKHQHTDGHWLPLWFGSQRTPDQKNPVYGTAKVLTYIEDALKLLPEHDTMARKLKEMAQLAANYLLEQQNPDGSWGAAREIPGTIEETALAICALAKRNAPDCRKGLEWIEQASAQGGLHASPIGLYFATLWYDEALYPLIYWIEALRRVNK